ncbi:putative triosephosphate isomerase [Streptomyces ambofaciens ATCC 23877]|uniref:Triosephosphate isomerase n=2 Tax=Streptomyces ambofaciens (strain ATCC 23877 / 3486 / DSM 40053 / JCM 4204 / NBRC 12836 / NRRL B-2516) TaxID=278992 RepID=A0A0K2AK15_STRA7|nr:putative triosephosphate isomerase [Streptomyces ambofaciens ATCC 23877]
MPQPIQHRTSAPTGKQPAMSIPSAPISFTSTKTQLGLTRSQDWIENLLLPNAERLAAVSFFACLPHPLLLPARQWLRGSGIGVAAQDVAAATDEVTGAVSASLLAEADCSHVMVGHAERRGTFGETDQLVARKAAAASAAGLTPVVCVGETDMLNASEAATLTSAQARTVVAAVPPERPLLFLYEPGWAIGGTEAADPVHAGHVLRALQDVAAGHHARFVYGGAVVPGVYTRLRNEADWDGVALGRAAQDPLLLTEALDELTTPK